MSIGPPWFRWVILLAFGASRDVVPEAAPAAAMHDADAAKSIANNGYGYGDGDGDGDGDDDPEDRVERRVTPALGLMTLLLFTTMATLRVSWRGSDIALG